MSNTSIYDSITWEPLRQDLFDWYQQQRRKLPWRETPSLYKTVVSELMLQQTQVDTMLPYFDRWLGLWPSFEALSQASEAQVLQAWQGLGYYTRARNLLKLAQKVVQLNPIPTDAATWKTFPGVGDYTAAAVTSIAFGTPEACVDGNVVRIVTRWIADETLYKDSVTAAKALKKTCQAILNPIHPGDHNQAMMELGATVCRKQKPLCLLCPVQAYCKAYKSPLGPEAFPKLASKATTTHSVERLWCLAGDKLLLHQHAGDSKRLAGFYELPLASLIECPKGALLFTGKRGISNQRIEERIYSLEGIPENIGAPLHWVALSTLESIPLSGPHRRWIETLIKK